MKRIAKKNTYTIGRLYILADEDVDRKVVTSYNEGLKRVFRDSFDEQKLGADTYFCDTWSLRGAICWAWSWNLSWWMPDWAGFRARRRRR